MYKLYPKADEEAGKVRESKTLVSNTMISEIEKDFKAWIRLHTVAWNRTSNSMRSPFCDCLVSVELGARLYIS